MKVLQINIFGNLSTGRIVVDLYRTLVNSGYEGKVAFARNTITEGVPYIKIGSKLNVYIDGVLTRLTDRAGFFSKEATKRLIMEIEKYNPDIIHLHNLHGYYINVEILVDYLKKRNKPVVWTLHDCWAFTGHCCYYSMANCERWKRGCFECPQKKAYPRSLFFDNSKRNYEKKKELFISIPKLQLVTVSKWLENEVKQSFLQNIPCTTIYNGIDANVFKHTESNFRRNRGLEGKFIILGVASTWDTRKGLNDFIKLSDLLTDEYRIVLVGVGKKEQKQLRPNMIGIERINNVQELAEIYSSADVFFNASVEETFGLPTVESISCGTPVIVYDATALPEVVTKENGIIVDKNDVDKVWKFIKQIKNNEISFNIGGTTFSKDVYFNKYLELYLSLIKNDRGGVI